MRARSRLAGRAAGFSALGGLFLLAACANDFDATRTPPPRGTLGEEMFGVLCDRVGAQALHDDLTGASFAGICHRDPTGKYVDKVDAARLPAMFEGANSIQGQPISLKTQEETRAHGIARIETFARRRAELIAALDFTIPDVKVPVKDVKNADPLKTCQAPQASGEGRLHDEIVALLGRFTEMYDDGTIPESTESLGRVMAAFNAAPEARDAYARLEARKGYRPIDIALGTTRPMLAYPHLRDLSNTLLRLVSADSNPFDPNAKKDESGRRIAEPGAAYPQLTKLLEVAHHELRDAKPDAVSSIPWVQPKDADKSGRFALTRERTNVQIAQELMFEEVLPPSGATPRYIVKRDARGYAAVAKQGDHLPAPFIAGSDGLPVIYDNGVFKTNDNSVPPSPFFATGTVPAKRDDLGRALDATGAPIYEYINTSQTFAASLLNDVRPLVNSDPSANHETLMYAVAGAHVLFGQRDGSPKTQRQYSADPTLIDAWKVAHPNDPVPPNLGKTPETLYYDAFHPETSALVDLVYALGQLMGDKTSDMTLAFAKEMIGNHTADVARLAGDALYAKTQLADKHPEAHIPAKSVLWDEILDAVIEIAKEPGLLEEVLGAFANDDNALLGAILGKFMSYRDHITYDRKNVNGPAWNATTNDNSEMGTAVDLSKAPSGDNRSGFHQFVQALHDTNGVAACNKPGAIVHAAGIPIFNELSLPNDSNALVRLNYGSKQSFGECEIFKIDNISKFYVQALVGAANLYFRDPFLRDGFLGIGASTVDIIQKSSGLTGFYDPLDAKVFRPTPQWMSRLVFFDTKNDSPNPGDPNYHTNRFVKDLQEGAFGTVLCEPRDIQDPVPNAADAAPDKMIRGLRKCQPGQFFQDRDLDSTFVLENFGFQKAIAPVVKAFVNHKREDLFMVLMEIVYRHWHDDTVPPADCDLGYDANKQKTQCTKDGVVSYQPLVSEVLSSDVMLALHDITKLIAGLKIPKCTAIGPSNADPSAPNDHACTAVEEVDGLKFLAETTRAAVDPLRAKEVGLTDRHGNVTSRRNDGTTNPQVTPIYLILQALNAVDDQFTAYAAAHPDDADRQAKWKMARSQLVDQFFDVDGQNTPKASFKNVALAKIAPKLIDVMRSQLWAHCPDSFVPPYTPCKWAREEQASKLADTVAGPTFAAGVDLFDTVRKDEGARRELERMITYLLDSASTNEALASMLTSAADAVQAMGDDTNLLPIFKVLAVATAPSVKDAKGRVVQKSLADAQLSFLSRINGRAFDENKNEVCGRELDPNEVLQVAMSKLVTPMPGANGQLGESPLEVIMDIIADVNRASPGALDKLSGSDYGSISSNLFDFLMNKERGMEQFYEIVRQGIVR